MTTTQNPGIPTNSYLEEMATASTNSAGQYIDKVGIYLGGIIECMDKTGPNKGNNGNSFVFKLRTLAAVPFGNKPTHQPGEDVSVAFNYDSPKAGKTARGNHKKVILAIGGRPESDFAPAPNCPRCATKGAPGTVHLEGCGAARLVTLAHRICQSDQPMLGKLMIFKGREGKNSAKEDRIFVDWYHVPQSKDELVQWRGRLMGTEAVPPAAELAARYLNTAAVAQTAG